MLDEVRVEVVVGEEEDEEEEEEDCFDLDDGDLEGALGPFGLEGALGPGVLHCGRTGGGAGGRRL